MISTRPPGLAPFLPSRPRALLALALATVWFALAPSTAYAGDDGAAALLFGPSVLALGLYPAGLAFHLLVLAYAPRRGVGLVLKADAHRTKTVILGVLNTRFVALLVLATHKSAPGLAKLAIGLWCALALIGSHALARGLGARVLGRAPSDGAPDDIRDLALGWFVLLFAAALPGLGLLVATYWAVRATGAVVLTLFSVPAEAPADGFKLEP